MNFTALPDSSGHFGPYGGSFVPETLMYALDELKAGYAKRDRLDVYERLKPTLLASDDVDITSLAAELGMTRGALAVELLLRPAVVEQRRVKLNAGRIKRLAIASDALLRLVGGILGRVDDMVIVRGVNVYPSAVEEILRRFADELHFTCAIPPSLLDVHIPKLTVQPLVENCVKHATKCAPPWHIAVVGEVACGRWQITQAPKATGPCTNFDWPTVWLWQRVHNSRRGSARRRCGYSEPCGSWHSKHLPSRTGGCSTFWCGNVWHFRQSSSFVLVTRKNLCSSGFPCT